MLGIIGAALAAGRAIVGAVQGNQTKQRNKGVIARTLARQKEQLGVQQADIRQSTNESLNARGLISPSAVQTLPTAATAPLPPKPTHPYQLKELGEYNRALHQQQEALAGGVGATGAANTLAGAANTNLTTEFARERRDLQEGANQAGNDNNAAYRQGLVNSGMNAIQDGFNVYNGMQAGQAAGAIQTGLQMAGAPALNAAMSTYAGNNASANRAAINRALPPMTGAYGMPVNPSFGGAAPSTRGTLVGDDLPSYQFAQ